MVVGANVSNVRSNSIDQFDVYEFCFLHVKNTTSNIHNTCIHIRKNKVGLFEVEVKRETISVTTQQLY